MSLLAWRIALAAMLGGTFWVLATVASPRADSFILSLERDHLAEGDIAVCYNDDSGNRICHSK